ncbi:MAG: response regulator [Candidatus Hydrothermarchaeota archaeon]
MERILIIEDDPQMRQGLAEMLGDVGYKVTAVGSGSEAIAKIRKQEFDVVLTDLVMPNVSGIEVLKEIKRHRPETHVIMITAFATIESAVHAMKEGASDYVSKPFKIDEIQITIKRVIEEAKFERKAHGLLSAKPSGAVGKLQPFSKSAVIKALSHPIRREAVAVLYYKGKSRFTDLKLELGIEDATKLSFHLRELKGAGLIEQTNERLYFLSPQGEEAVKTLMYLERGGIS